MNGNQNTMLCILVNEKYIILIMCCVHFRKKRPTPKKQQLKRDFFKQLDIDFYFIFDEKKL